MSRTTGAGDPWVVVLTRPEGKLAEGRKALEARGFRVVEAPLLVVEPHHDPVFADILEGLRTGAIAYVVLTSATGVRFALETAAAEGEDLVARLQGTPVVTVGLRTAEAARDAGIPIHAVPDEHSSAGLVAWFEAHGTPGATVAVVRSTRGSPVLPEGLRHAGFRVLEAAVYHLARPPADPRHRRALDAILAGEVDAVTFTSSLTAEHLLELARDEGVEPALREALATTVVAAIGEPTRATLEGHDIPVDVVPTETTFEALAEALAARRAGSR